MPPADSNHGRRDLPDGFFEALADQSFEGVTVADNDGNYIYVNRTFCEMIGYSREELLAMTVFDVKAPEQDHSSFDRSRSSEEGVPFEVILRRKDGSDFVSEVLGKVLDLGDRTCVLGLIRDITERTRAARALRRSEDRLVEAQRTAKLGHYVLDITSGEWTSSPELDRIFGIDESFGRTVQAWSDLIHPDDRDDMVEYFGTHVLTEHHEFDRRYRVVDQVSGTVKWVHGRGRLKFDPDGNPREMFGVIQDITETVVLEDQLQQAQKMESIGRLAGGVAHDFNNMLGVILGHAELALAHVHPGDPLHDDLRQIQSAAESSADLTRQLLAFARKQTIAPRVLDVNETVAGMIDMLGRLLGEDLDLSWRPGDDVWPVYIDPIQVKQVLVNLCVNARDAVEGPGTVTIETENVRVGEAIAAAGPDRFPGDYVLLRVTDSGRGMDPETLTHLYEPFYTTKKDDRGTGLGLATVYGIVSQNGGFIDVDSEPGRGSVFLVHWPRRALADPEPSRESRAEPTSGSETVLLVEDEPTLLEMTSRVLETLGYHVLAAESPGRALELAGVHGAGIGAVCSDVVMPGMSGPELVARLRESRPGLRAVFMSGYTADKLDLVELDAATTFLEKPVSINALATALRNLLDA